MNNLIKLITLIGIMQGMLLVINATELPESRIITEHHQTIEEQ
jgi:hypothetical protein